MLLSFASVSYVCFFFFLLRSSFILHFSEDIPLRIVPAHSRGPRVLEKLAQLQLILLQEERAAYDQSLIPRKPNRYSLNE